MKQRSPDTCNIALIGVPSSAGARLIGQEQAPMRLREAGLVQGLQSDGHDVTDMGNTAQVSFAPDPAHARRQNLPLVLNTLSEIRDRVDSAVSDKKWPLIIGGDCTITIGILAALIKHFPNLGLIYLDGDVDLNTPDTTFTGILDGMVLAHVIGRGADELSHFGPRYPILDGSNITLFGYSPEAGGIDPIEKEQLKVTVMDKYPLAEVRDSVEVAATRALRNLERKVDHILVHFDVDVIDENDFPAADVPHTPGLSRPQIAKALKIFLRSPKSAGLVVTEFNATRDKDGSLAEQLVDLIREAKAQR